MVIYNANHIKCYFSIIYIVFITVFLSRFDTFLQCNVLVLKTISTAIQTQNYLNQTGVFANDYKTHSAVDAQIR